MFEARRWAYNAFEMRPENLQAQRLIAQVLDREIAHGKSLPQGKSPEEFTDVEKSHLIKTWLERSQGFLQMGAWDEALLTAEQVFQMDPQNLEASRLIDQIKEKARKEAKGESIFLQDLYQREIDARIQRYVKQAEAWRRAGKEGAARLAVEKILILDPENRDGRRLLAQLDIEGETARPRPSVILRAGDETRKTL